MPKERTGHGLSRRSVLAGLGGAAGTASLASFAGPASAAGPLGDGRPGGGDVVIRETYVMTMDAALGDLERGDVLIRDGEISRVGRNVPAPAATEIDGRDMITMPGFVDTHNHLWLTQTRGYYANTPETTYFGASERFGRAFEAADMAIGTLLGDYEALASGITTTVDFNDNVRGPAFAEEPLRAHRESGIRVRFLYGAHDDLPENKTVDLHYLETLAKAWPDWSEGGRITLGLGWRGPGSGSPAAVSVARDEANAARRLGLPLSVHASGQRSRTQLDGLVGGGLLGSDVQVIHATDATGAQLAAIEKARASIALTPVTEQRVGYGLTRLSLYEPVSRLGLGIDGNALAGSADMFGVMRLLALTETGASRSETAVRPLRLLRLATAEAARAIGMDSSIGTLTPGKRADLIMIDTREVNLGRFTGGPPYALVVYSAQPSDVKTVMVGGRLVKQDGRLLDVDLPRLRDRARASMRAVLQRTGGG
ncbi:Cytosine/adenosine deaminase [Sinosporangium album]|uniref:Cytosine/adenosine deaminase n=1 Tax=Sinosporangium album TaxID=504805 RepID=A0A1G7ZTN2_9ACTN|nr:amidohydrolase family protein [Sinosporangium album]SDH11977.1 Cytosine/adenosine deaminase [Sinosporangium album]